MMTLKGKTLFITGASRGIGLAIALRAARDGANIVVAAKTEQAHSKLPGTIHSAVDQIEAHGGHGLACACDIRSEEQIAHAVERACARFGGIDILVNNASAISLTGTLETETKRFDLMHQINVRGTFLVSRACIPHLARGSNPHILNLAPPLHIRPEFFSSHVAYSVSKFDMSLFALGMAEELRPKGIAVNCLWPRTIIATAAIANLPEGSWLVARARKPEIVADAAYEILTSPSQEHTGHFHLDETLLRSRGVTDFDAYAVVPGNEPLADLFT